jgi:hypothetical protein
MNERIRQLAEQATTITYEEDGWRLYGTKVETFNKEKFAELIVGECYLWAKENGGLGCEEDFEALKEHFGVEE